MPLLRSAVIPLGFQLISECRSSTLRRHQTQQAADEERPADLQGTPRSVKSSTHRLHLRRMPSLAVWREPSGHQGILPACPALRLHQYTDLTEENKQTIEQVLPQDSHRGFRGESLETAKTLREQRDKSSDKTASTESLDQLEFKFVLFASAVIDYDYIMGLIAKFSATGPGKSKMTREELIGLISADAKFMNERDEIAEYIGMLKAGEGLSETTIRDGYNRFKAEKNAKELADIAAKHQLATAGLQTFVDSILDRMIFDGEQLGDLMTPLDLGWKARTQAELSLMEDCVPYLIKRAGGRDISGLSAYEQ